MTNGFPVFMLIFSGVLLLYSVLLAITKDEKMLPLRVQGSYKGKNKQKLPQLAKAIAVAAVAPALSGAVGFWNNTAGLIMLILGLIAGLWAGTKIAVGNEERKKR